MSHDDPNRTHARGSYRKVRSAILPILSSVQARSGRLFSLSSKSVYSDSLPRHVAMFGLLDYRDWPHCGLHSPRTKRMTQKSAVTPSARSVQTKKKAPLELAMLLPTPTR
jgi:hypothetical protein